MATVVTVLPKEYTDPDKVGITETRVHTLIPSGYGWINFLGTDCFTEPGKQTWMPGESRLVTTAEQTRLAALTLWELSGGPGQDGLA